MSEEEEEDLDSVDFEQQLKKECEQQVQIQLDMFEKRLNYLISEHEASCKAEFKMYETHIKEQVLKMNEYVTEMHSNHIGEIASFKREKNEQLLINQMIVQKMQSMDVVRK